MTKKPQLENASAFSRIFAFVIDVILANALRAFFQAIFTSKEDATIYNSALEQFAILFPDFKMNTIADYHVFFFTNNMEVCGIFVKMSAIFLLSGTVYNLLSYAIFHRRTIGQRCMSLEVNNINNNETPKFYKFALKSFLTSFPFMVLNILIFSTVMNMFGFHKLIIANRFSLKILALLITVSNPFVVAPFTVIFIFCWFNTYFLSERLILGDILSRTRVVNRNFLIKRVSGKNGEERIELKGDAVVECGDKILRKAEKISAFFEQKLTKTFQYLGSKFRGKK
ncbi:MAG: RDD family protein [Rickettsiales bacterium]|jgi:hypothetical protein|nr:RDD family protein [Rickettsiales bacterium]